MSFGTIDIYIKNTSRKALVSAIKKLYVLRYTFFLQAKPGGNVLIPFLAICSWGSSVESYL